ncbi:beta-1,2-xylosyltransferase XYXT1-like [Oryza brachyantha]|uniref:beta-1,2-xylosyltransferase XYXT1-like n=1 Tax=Oryza brachyantha TaxID=4533 RepID=UPI001AD99DE3|nr:beta-1,2-xylosyltransferase XYXT1-like [Oryza brachyantha]
MEGGGKAAYSYVHHHHEGKLLKSVSRVEPRRFGLGLVAGFLLVTCAYFSTAKFDAIHIAMISSPAKNAAGVGSLVNAAASDGSSSKQQLDLDRDALSREGSKAEVLDNDDKISSLGPDLVHNASVGGEKKDETFADASVPASGGGKDEEVLAKDGDALVGAVLPPLSSEDSTNSTEDSDGLEEEELQVQEAAANPPQKKSSNNGSSTSPTVVASDPATLPVQQIPVAAEAKAPVVEQIPAVPEAKAPPVQQIPAFPEVKRTEAPAPRKEWKPLCDLWSNRRIDWCELDGDARVSGADGTVTLVAPPGPADERTFRPESWRIKPYPRKADPNAMRNVRVLTVQSLAEPAASSLAPACTVRHDVPGLLFSDRGYTGNYFHAYTDVILPLFLTAKQYSGEVKFLVSDFQMWWLGKFLPVFKGLSNYELINLDDDRRVHCFRHVQVGLTCHADFSIDPSRAPNGYTMVDFTRFMRATYGLPRAVAGGGRRPRLLVIARARTRRFVNADEIVRGAERVGFEVVVSEGTHEVAPFAELANTCDAVVGVHGAGLTNMVFLPTGGVVIQVVPLGGLEFVAGYFRGPSRDMGLRYLEYRITPEESTLIDQYPRDHPIFTDPDGVKSKGWVSLKEAYLDKQDVRLDMKRFRPILKKAIAHLRQHKSNNNTTLH